MEHRYIQVNRQNQFNSGHSTVQLERTETGKIRILDRWEWESQAGQGFCIFEEV